jgi:hypothetical protein
MCILSACGDKTSEVPALKHAFKAGNLLFSIQQDRDQRPVREIGLAPIKCEQNSLQLRIESYAEQPQ